MKVLGLIMEINPLHNGHIYFINQAKALTSPDITIIIMSSSFTMRGETMIMDKFSRTKLLLEKGADLVFELPFLSTVNSADLFGLNSVSILRDLNVTDISFGAELRNIEKLKLISNYLNSKEFNTEIQRFIKLGNSYATSALKALTLLTDDAEIINNFSLPNNTLAVQYINAAKKLNYPINFFPIKRIGNNYYDKTITSKIASATAIRELIKNKEPLNKFVPDEVAAYPFKGVNLSEEKIYNFLKFIFINKKIDEITNIYGVDEGIENRISTILNETSNYSSFMEKVVSKRYSYYRIQRTILHILLNTPKNLQSKSNYYLRMLGCNDTGLEYINSLPKETKKAIITSVKNLQNNIVVDYEIKATKLYDLLTNSQTILEEYKIPIKKGDKYVN